jgi:Family of unknown function (DUF5937)
MIRRELSVADLLRCRFAISPVSEVVELARAIANPAARAAHSASLRRHGAALERIAAAYDLRPLVAVTRPGVRPPDFLRPPPSGPSAEIDVELEQVRATPAEQVRAEVRRSLRGHGPIAPDVERALLSDGAAGRLADVLAVMWTGLVAPSWHRIRACLERDLLYRSRVLAGRGLATVLEDIAPSVAFHRAHLRAHRDGHELGALDDAGILLVPSAFIWPRTAAMHLPTAGPLTLSYPARGIEAMWIPSPERAGAAHRTDPRTDPRGAGRTDAHHRARPRTPSLARQHRRPPRRAQAERAGRQRARGRARDLLANHARRRDAARLLRGRPGHVT